MLIDSHHHNKTSEWKLNCQNSLLEQSEIPEKQKWELIIWKWPYDSSSRYCKLQVYCDQKALKSRLPIVSTASTLSPIHLKQKKENKNWPVIGGLVK